MRNICVIDAETHDPSLKRYGSGAVFKFHYPEVDFRVLGFGIVDNKGYKIYIDLTKDYENNLKLLLSIISKYDTWIFHNGAYDLACLKYLFRDIYLNEIKEKEIRDTMLMLKLHDQQLVEKSRNRKVYGLEGSCKYFKLMQGKESDILHDYAWNSGLYQRWYTENKLATKGKAGNCHKKPKPSILDNFCKSNMHLFPTEIIADYCLQDCVATLSLYQFLVNYQSDDTAIGVLHTISEIIKECLEIKFRGIRINLAGCSKLSKEWANIADESENIVCLMLGCPDDFNINSGEKLGKALEADGYKPIPRTDAGNYSIVASWLEEQKEEIFDHIRRYRKAKKAEKDYIQKLIKYQDIIPAKYKTDGIGWIYPTLKPLGAMLTGRFSSGGGTGSLELNVLAISGRDKEFGQPVRSLFLPYNDNEKIICADFSNQEPRLMVHYAKLLGCDRIQEVVDDWVANPNMKYHQKVADMTSLEYNLAKTVTLGLAYDMHSFGLSNKLKITKTEAEILMKQYYEMLPFMKQLQDTCAANLKRLGYIRTLDGRKLYIDQPYYFNGRMRTQERKAMSKLIQGSAAGQTMKSIIRARDAGLKIMLCVHDELICSSPAPVKDLEVLQDAMENSYKLVVPVVADGGIGNNWLEAKP